MLHSLRKMLLAQYINDSILMTKKAECQNCFKGQKSASTIFRRVLSSSQCEKKKVIREIALKSYFSTHFEYLFIDF